MKNLKDESHSKLIRIGFIPNLYSCKPKIRSSLLISFIKQLKC